MKSRYKGEGFIKWQKDFPELEKNRIEKIRKSHIGKKFTIVHRRKLSEAKKALFRTGKLTPWNKGLTLEDDKRVKPPLWNNNYICEDCGSKLHVEIHHKNFNKFDNSPEDRIKWCRSCHKKWHMDFRKRNGLISFIRDKKGRILKQVHVKLERGNLYEIS